MKQTDFGQVANSYARSREDIPVVLMDSLQLRNIFWEGKKVADIGAGTGALTRKIAMRKADVVGIEPSKEMTAQALALNVIRNFQIPYLLGTAEITGLEDSKFDIVTVMRAWHWFDRPKANAEMKRILKANGTLIVIDSGFLTGTNVIEKTLEVLSKYVEGGLIPAGSKAGTKQCINGFPVEWFEEWQESGFELRDFYKLNYTVDLLIQEWVDRIESVSWLADLDESVRKEALKELLNSLSEQEPFKITHECNVCILRLSE
ncbi:class I SAM-dependent methyltransferase [Neobacillus drentensis]|uniref:class I SAM-dependent methyltransferase n=1 Tax=Neobacillus drentensis TaxID=220684 RepID=UPI002FFF2072